MAMNSGGSNGNLPLSDINVTPLVDVMLVLLIIFMVAAPHLDQGVKIDLPEATVEPFPAKTDELVIKVTKSKKIILVDGTDESAVSMDKLKYTVEQTFTKRASKDVYIRADKNVPYGLIVKIMAEAKKAGATKIGMVADPEEIK
jgi:biopolymer transport protein TolR